MLNLSPSWTMISLDVIMIVYTLWAISSAKPLGKLGLFVGLAMLAWLGVLHVGLSNKAFFAADVSGVTFLTIVFAAVGLVGILLWLALPLRRFILGLDQQQLMLVQGIRVFFGATFLMQASLGVLPPTFGIIDGLTHTGAGFFGLVAAFSLAAGNNGARRAWFANIFGLADILIVATSLSLVLLPEIGPHHPMMYAVFLPAPIWLWIHVISIMKLLGFQPDTAGVVTLTNRRSARSDGQVPS